MSSIPSYAPLSYNGGFITLSYIISVVGAITTLELLRRVTSTRGWLNWVLLIASAFSMGGVSIWSMHYIGNRAIVLYNGEAGWQLNYGAGYTILSFFLPVVVLLLAYAIIGAVETPRYWRLILGGTFAGAAVCGMHYLGQLSIVNYASTYNVGNVVGSVIIAIAATNIALVLFFRLRQKWDDSFWKRAGCALLLAGACSGMHWCAASGTSYTLLLNGGDASSGEWTVIVVAVISFLSCLFLMAFAFEAGRRARKRKNRAQKVVLACATFDPDGKVMLTTDGMFPCREITDSFYERSFDDSFDTAHPVFLWIFRASFYWDSIRDLIPGMRSHLKDAVTESSADYSLLFREMFCVSAQALADSMSLPLESLGIAYDQILETGIVSSRRAPQASAQATRATANRSYGRGQCLFLVKHASKSETHHLMSSGYRFADPSNVIGLIARAMQITRMEAESQLRNMRYYYGPENSFPSGVHIGFLGMRPNVQKGFNVVVREDRSHVIPSLQLPVRQLSEEHKEFVISFAGKTVTEILNELRSLPPTKSDYDMQAFRSHFHGAVVSLSQEIKESAFMDAVLLPQFFQVSSAAASSDEAVTNPATLIILRSIVPIHNSCAQLLSSRLTYSPLSLFLTQQSILTRSSRTTFTRESRKEFYALFEMSMASSTQVSHPQRRPWRVFSREIGFAKSYPLPWELGHFMEEGKARTGLGHEVAVESGNELIQLTPPVTPGAEDGEPFNGIVVQKSVSVMVRDKDVDDASGSAVTNSSMSEFESVLPLNDEAVWADICFKGIIKGH